MENKNENKTAHRCKFHGRKLGAIGIMYTIYDVCYGDTEEEQKLSLYDRYDHVTQFKLIEAKENE